MNYLMRIIRQHFVVLISAILIMLLTITYISSSNQDECVDNSITNTILPKRLYLETNPIISNLDLVHRTDSRVSVTQEFQLICRSCNVDDILFVKGDYIPKNTSLFDDSDVFNAPMFVKNVSSVEQDILVDLYDYGNLSVVFYVPQDIITYIHYDTEIKVYYSEIDYDATVLDYGIDINEQGLSYVLIGFSDDIGIVRNGGSVSVEILLETRTNVMLLDESFLHYNNGVAYVEILAEDGKIIQRQVETGSKTGSLIEIVTGLGVDDVVIFR